MHEVHEPIPPALQAALKQFGTHAVPHSGRTLEQHLQGTWRLLEHWGCEEHVCLAGMFHSIYGTNAFHTACLPQERRETLRSLIGASAERLVFLFASTERPAAFLHALAGEALQARDGSELPASRSEVQALLAIECANLLEQGADAGLIEVLRRLPAAARDSLLGPRIAAAIETSN